MNKTEIKIDYLNNKDIDYLEFIKIKSKKSRKDLEYRTEYYEV